MISWPRSAVTSPPTRFWKVWTVSERRPYRALDHLTEMGLIRRLSLGKKSAVYEYIRTNHMHFVCEQCGSVYDIEADFTGMAAEAAKCCGHRVNWCEVTAHGVCKDCLSRQKASTGEG